MGITYSWYTGKHPYHKILKENCLFYNFFKYQVLLKQVKKEVAAWLSGTALTQHVQCPGFKALFVSLGRRKGKRRGRRIVAKGYAPDKIFTLKRPCLKKQKRKSTHF